MENVRVALTGWLKCPTCGHLHTGAGRAACKHTCCASDMLAVTVHHCAECNGYGSYRDQVDDDRPWATYRCTSCSGKGVLPG